MREAKQKLKSPGMSKKIHSLRQTPCQNPMEPAVAEDEANEKGPAQLLLTAELIHELRTPLVVVRGYAKMLLEERAGPLNNTQREYLNIMVDNADRVVRLLRDLERRSSQ